MGENERRQQGELLQLRREHQALQEAMHRACVDLAETREKLQRSEDDAGRQQVHAARAAAEDGGAVMQLHALRSKVAGASVGGQCLTSYPPPLPMLHPTPAICVLLSALPEVLHVAWLIS